MSDQKSRTCGNCATTQPFNATHVTCLNMACRACGCLKAKTTGGCKKWSGGVEDGNAR